MNQPNQAQAPNDPFEGLSGGLAAVNIEPTTKLKAAVIAPPKNGKTWFACTAPGKILHYDYDDRKQSLANHPNRANIYTKTLRDTLAAPTVVRDLETDLSNLKYRKAAGKAIPDSYIHDTVSNLIANGIVNAYLKENPSDGRRIKLAGTLPQQIGISFDRINVTTRFLDYILTEYSALGHVIFVFHERDEKDKAESTKDVIKYTGQVTIEPQFAANILTLFNDVFRIKVGGDGKYKVFCKPNYDFTASTTLLLDSEEPPDLTAMIKKHEDRKIAEKKAAIDAKLAEIKSELKV